MDSGLTLPDGRSLVLADGLLDVICAGVLIVDDIRIGPGDAVHPLIEARAAVLRDLYAGQLPSEIEPLREARDLYKSVGISPSRTRPSSEALLRRILKGGSLYRINNAVDVCNLASIEFLLPIGLYDLQKIDGDIALRLGREGEEYPGIRKGPVHLGGRMGLFDDRGPFGSPTSDSLRTSIDDRTRRLMAVIMATAAYPEDAMRDHLGRYVDLTTRFCGGTGGVAGILGRP